MSPYAILGSSVGTAEAAALCVRLTAWHDAMVAHERRLRTGRTADACDDECPHDEARTLWTEALTTLGPRASELTFLRSRANGVSPSPQEVVAATTVVSVAADGAPHTNRKRSRAAARASRDLDRALAGCAGGTLSHDTSESTCDGDALTVLFDGRRMVSYTHGFAASPSQLELLVSR